MGKPAARLGDPTVHGGIITLGFPTVLIGGQPAARLGDMQVCPLVTGVVPHVGGIISLGSAGVFIGGQPAARMGDITICVGPPGTIAMGFPTVLIGEIAAGAGGGGGGGAGGAATAAEAAAHSATVALIGGGGEQASSEQGSGAPPPGSAPPPGTVPPPGSAPPPGTTTPGTEGHWIEFQFVDTAGNPVSNILYEFTAPDGKESVNTLGGNGTVRWTGQDAGQGKVKFIFITNAHWSQQEAQVGETVKLMADVEGYDPGTPAIFRVYEQNVSGSDRLIATITAETQGDKVEAEWGYEYPEDIDKAARKGYSSPQYYFEVAVGRGKDRSGLLEYKDYVEIEVKGKDDKPFAHEEYILYLPNGTVRKGNLDQNGFKKEENIPPGYCRLKFPRLARVK